MLTTLTVAELPTQAAALTFTLDEPPLPPVATLPLVVGGVPVEVRIRPAAHQVLAGPLVETVAALAGRPGPLPYQLRREVGGWSHTFTADVYCRSKADFEHAVAFVGGYLADRDDALAVAWAGAPGALSGVLLRPVRRGLDWRAWHTFPEARELVVTRSRMLVG